jgi:hypothetical protein
MTFKEFFNFDKKIGARHLKNDGLLNTSVPHKPIADMNKAKKADGTEEVKATQNKTVILNNLEKIKELKRKHPYITSLKPGESKKIIGTNISISLNPNGGYLLTNND